jgi:hypothetical protein
MIAKLSSGGLIYYVCARTREHACDNRASIREDRLYTALVKILNKIASQPESIDAYLEDQQTANIEMLLREIEGVSKSLSTIQARRAKWDTAYEEDVINLDEYKYKIDSLNEESTRLTEMLSILQRRQKAAQNHERQRDFILRNLNRFPKITPENRGMIKQRLRVIIDKIVIENGKMIRVTFND